MSSRRNFTYVHFYDHRVAVRILVVAKNHRKLECLFLLPPRKRKTISTNNSLPSLNKAYKIVKATMTFLAGETKLESQIGFGSFEPFFNGLLGNGHENASPSVESENPLLMEQAANSKALESLQAEELAKMSAKEREQDYETIHGVDELIDETPEFVAEQLAEFDEALRSITNKLAYDQAERINKDYVKDEKFRLSFLRADLFNPRKAAHRLVRFMEGKLEFFGPHVLCRPIYMSDLDDDDMEYLKSGMFQVLSSRDRVGRTVVMHHLSESRPYKTPENLVSRM